MVYSDADISYSLPFFEISVSLGNLCQWIVSINRQFYHSFPNELAKYN